MGDEGGSADVEVNTRRSAVSFAYAGEGAQGFKFRILRFEFEVRAIVFKIQGPGV